MYQTSRGKKKLSEEWVQWLLQCAMTRFPESIQINGLCPAVTAASRAILKAQRSFNDSHVPSENSSQM